jgi:ABC-2 type transport system ATP-binding protein
VGLVTDTPGLYEQMTLPAYLDFFGAVYGIPQAERKRKIAELISFFDLGAHQRERMVGFSKGMKQKVALARALLHDPVALFLDEPTSGTHDLDEAERLADEIAIMRAGAIVRHGAPSALRADSSPETTVSIRFAEPLPDVERALVGLPLQIESTSAVIELAYATPDPVGVNPEVIARLVAAGARIVAVDCATRALEDIYAEALGAETSDATRQAVAGIVD